MRALTPDLPDIPESALIKAAVHAYFDNMNRICRIRNCGESRPFTFLK